MQAKLFPLIKTLSMILITGALGLEVWHGLAALERFLFPEALDLGLGLGRFALGSHLIEALIAGVYASKKQKLPLRYGVYTFFVGTVGLVELFRADPDLG